MDRELSKEQELKKENEWRYAANSQLSLVLLLVHFFTKKGGGTKDCQAFGSLFPQDRGFVWLKKE